MLHWCVASTMLMSIPLIISCQAQERKELSLHSFLASTWCSLGLSLIDVAGVGFSFADWVAVIAFPQTRALVLIGLICCTHSVLRSRVRCLPVRRSALD